MNRLLDTLSNFIAARKGLLIILGIVFIIINAVLQFFPELGWLVDSNLLLHVGLVVALIGVMLAWAL